MSDLPTARRCPWLLAAGLALWGFATPATAQPVESMTCAGAQFSSAADFRAGIACNYQQTTSYQPTYDGGPWIYIDLLTTTLKELENIRAGTTKRPAWQQQASGSPPPMPPIHVVHMTVCLSDPNVSYTQCPNNYPENNSVLGYQLSPQIVPQLAVKLGEIRQAGLKVVLNFTYNWPNCASADPKCKPRDAPMSVIMDHMVTLSQTLLGNADVIAGLHAGFIGQWGEWHDSTTGNDDTDAHNKFLDLFIALFGKSISLEVRYPYVILDYAQYRFGSAAPHMAYRIPLGIHDDEYGSNPGDGGTFLPATYPGATAYDACDLLDTAHMASRHNTLTAEMWNNAYSRGQVCRNRPESFLEFSRDYSLTSLHLGLQPATWQGWVGDSQYDLILRSIGPHLALESLAVLELAGQPMAMIKIANTGTAKIARSRPLSLVIQRNGQTVSTQALGADLKDVAAGQSVTVEAGLGTALAQPGHYTLYLSAPDTRLPNDPRYALLFENVGVPDPATGLNALMTLQVGN